MKNIIVGAITVFVLGIMGFVATDDAVWHGGQHAKVIEDFGDGTTVRVAAVIAPKEKDDRAKEMDKLGALRDKAGNVGAFKVSRAYKSKCSSCHGVNGSGFQNGRKMMGAKLFGLDAEKVYKDLIDFKSGRRENMIMKGLLLKLNKEQLREFADEIGEFPARAKALAAKNK